MRFVCVRVSVEEGITLINRGQGILEGQREREKWERERETEQDHENGL